MKQFFQAAKRPSGPKALLFVLLFALLGLNLSAQGLWPSTIPSPLFPPLPGLVLPQPQSDDGTKTSTTVGEMRLALTYFQGYLSLYEFVQTKIIPDAEQVVKQYNRLVFNYKLVVITSSILVIAAGGFAIYTGLVR